MKGLKKLLKVLNNNTKVKIWIYYSMEKNKFIFGREIRMSHDLILIMYKKNPMVITEKEFLDYADKQMDLYCKKRYGVNMTYKKEILKDAS